MAPYSYIGISLKSIIYFLPFSDQAGSMSHSFSTAGTMDIFISEYCLWLVLVHVVVPFAHIRETGKPGKPIHKLPDLTGQQYSTNFLVLVQPYTCNSFSAS